MRLQHKLILFFACIFGIAVMLMVLYSLRSQKQLAHDAIVDLQNVVSAVHFSTLKFSAKQTSDKDTLYQFIDEVMENTAIEEISIINKDGEIVVSSNPSKEGTKYQELWQEKKETNVTKGQNPQGPGKQLQVTIPIYDNQSYIGQIEATIVVSDPNKQLRTLSFQTICIAISAFIIFLVVSFFALMRFTKPLARLGSAALKISSGDLSVRITKTSEDEIGQLTDSFNSMILKLHEQKGLEERLHDMERRSILSETAATLAHEIRNPLNLINLTAGYLANQYLPQQYEQQEPYLKLIEELKAQVRHLNSMVNQFLAIGKPLEIHKQRFPLFTLCKQVEMLVKQQLVSKEMEITMDIPTDLMLFADLEHMRLVILNLFINAIEVSSPKARISLHAFHHENTIVVKISDTGPGIEPRHREKIFEPYFSQRPGGTGLGLTFAKRIIEGHDGTIVADNNQDGGALFTIKLPS